ncbi:MAG: hypothetical protein ABWY36_08440 [Leifsonia sp.]
MANSPGNRRDKRRGSSRPAGRPRQQPSAGHDDDELASSDLIDTIDQAVNATHPLPLFTIASTTIAAMESDSYGLGASLDDLAESFLDTALPQTDALLLVMAELLDDEEWREHIQREVAVHGHPLPEWIHRLGDARAGRVVMATHVLRDGDTFFVAVTLPAGQPVTLIVYVDHNMGTIIKDAYTIDRSLDEVIDAWSSIDEGSTRLSDVAPADGRAFILDALEGGELLETPIASDNWPSEQALLEWIVDMLPEGGTGYQWLDTGDDLLEGILSDFFESRYAEGLVRETDVLLATSIVEFAGRTGLGDPLRWSPAAVEVLLVDRLPRSTLIDPVALARAPEVLRAVIRFAHDERDIPADLTAETLAAVDEWEQPFRDAIGL